MLKKKLNKSSLLMTISTVLLSVLFISILIVLGINFHILEKTVRIIFILFGSSLVPIFTIIKLIYNKINEEKKKYDDGIKKLERINRKDREEMAEFKGLIKTMKHLDLSKIKQPFRGIIEDLLNSFNIPDEEDDFHSAVIDQLK